MVENGSGRQLIKSDSKHLGRVGSVQVPAIIAAAGQRANKRFFEFFTENIENQNTREAYARDVGQFFAWCEEKNLTLEKLEPIAVAAYLKHLQEARQRGGTECSKPTRKRKLAAIRMMFDYLVTGSSDYIQLYRGDKQMLVESLQFIRQVSKEILGSLNPGDAKVSVSE